MGEHIVIDVRIDPYRVVLTITKCDTITKGYHVCRIPSHDIQNRYGVESIQIDLFDHPSLCICYESILSLVMELDRVGHGKVDGKDSRNSLETPIHLSYGLVLCICEKHDVCVFDEGRTPLGLP